MTKMMEKKYSKARWFIAGMGTILTVAPMATVDRTSQAATANDRVANATVRVGGYFRTVLKRQGLRESRPTEKAQA